jgi:hypothetical protein
MSGVPPVQDQDAAPREGIRVRHGSHHLGLGRVALLYLPVATVKGKEQQVTVGSLRWGWPL